MAASKLSAEASALYDRAIRLWGAEAQRRLMSARVLILGLNGVSAEVSARGAFWGHRVSSFCRYARTSS
jgi:hypothetical protein